MTIKLGSDGFPKRGLSQKRQKEWLAANRPAGNYGFDADFYWSQAKAFTRGSLLWSRVALVFLTLGGLAFVGQIVLIVLGAAI